MLTIKGRSIGSFCDGISRRSFLKVGALGMGGLALPQLLQAEELSGQKPRSHKGIIMIYLAGGPPHLDMFDMKPTAPAEIRGEFSPIRTNVPGIEVCEHFPEMAKMMDKFAIIRSIGGLEDRHESNICFGGYNSERVAREGHPAVGPSLSKLYGPVDRSVPPFVCLARKTAHVPWSNPGEPGFLGPAHSAFRPDGPGMDNMILHGSPARLEERRQLLQGLNKLRNEIDSSGKLQGIDSFTQQALGVLNSSKLVDALNLEKESKSIRDRYGYGSLNPVDDGPCAEPQDFLVARRLIEAGVRCVTLTFCRWDWHDRNFVQGRQYMPMLDKGVSALVRDLHERGLDKDVSVVMWGEFGRTPKINNTAGRDHWAPASFAVVAGGGLRTGQVIGATDRYGQRPISGEVHHQQVLATLYHSLGIDVNQVTITDPRGRPQYLVDQREVIKELI